MPAPVARRELGRPSASLDVLPPVGVVGAGPFLHGGAPRPVVPRGFEPGGDLRVLPDQVVLLGAVGLHVEELPGLAMAQDQLPPAGTPRPAPRAGPPPR